MDYDVVTPRVAAYALRDIYQGEEIVFDYGVRDAKIPWLRNREVSQQSKCLCLPVLLFLEFELLHVHLLGT